MAQPSTTAQETSQAEVPEEIILRQDELRRRHAQEIAEAKQAATTKPSAGVSILDLDFLIFALPLAGLLDILSYIFMGMDAGVIAAVINFVLGGLLVLWMVARGKRMDEARAQHRQGVRTARQGRAGMKQRRMATKRMSRRLLKRSLIMYIGNSIPIVNFIPFWIIGVIMMLRQK